MAGARGHVGRRPAAGLAKADDPGDEYYGGDEREDLREEQPVTAGSGLPAERVLEDQGPYGQRGGAADGDERGGGHAHDRSLDRRTALVGVSGQVVAVPGGPGVAGGG